METALGWGLPIGGRAVAVCHWFHIWSFLVLSSPPLPMADATSWVAPGLHKSLWFNALSAWAVLFPCLFVGILAPLSGTSSVDPDINKIGQQ